MRALLIAEKPSLMREIRDAYNDMTFRDTIDFAHFVGHLMTLAMPESYDKKYSKWSLEDLPIVPNNFKLNHVKGTNQLYQEIKNKIKNNHYDYVINACDAAREGELIFWNFYESLNLKNLPPVKRLWAQDTTKTTLQKALNNLIDEDTKEMQRLRDAAQLRSYWDWLLGINLSRAVSVYSNKTMAIGRVMTATLSLIVKRDEEISQFRSESFYELHGRAKSNDGQEFDIDYISDSGIIRQANKNAFIGIEPKKLKVEEVNTIKISESAPLPYSLADLQKDANTLYGFSAKKTLDIAQSLYEKRKILSYPRTDSRFIPTEVAKDIGSYLQGIFQIEKFKKFHSYIDNNEIKNFYKNTKYVNDKKITDHHGLIPTVNFKPNDLQKLGPDEEKIFMLVAQRIFQIFLRDYKYQKTSILLQDGKYRFRSNGSVLQDLGFKVLWKVKTLSELPPLHKGEEVEVIKLEVKELKTQPKKPYTEATLLQDMINVGKDVADNTYKKILKDVGGLGTAATRAEIINKLYSYKYIEKHGKSLSSTNTGKELINTVKDYSFSEPLTTAIWEKTLIEVEEGQECRNKVMEEFMNYINENVENVVDASNKKLQEQNGAVVGKCPRCGENVRITNWSYACANYKNQDGGPTCDFSIGRTIRQTSVDIDDIKAMLNGGKSKTKHMEFDSGTSGDVQLYIQEDGSLGFSFVQESLGKCPACGKNVVAGKNYYYCENYKGDVDPCNFIVGKKVLGANISTKDIKELLTKGQIKKTFNWKNGKSSEAYLVLEDGHTAFKFEEGTR